MIPRLLRASHASLVFLALATIPVSSQLASANPNGVWSSVGPPAARYGHAAIYDPVRRRMVVYGGFEDYRASDVWSYSLDDPRSWTHVLATGTAPLGRFGHNAIYDPVRDRMLIVGGDDVDESNEVWSLPLADNPPAWSLIVNATPPPARAEFTAIYDSPRDRVIIFGGYAGTFLNDVWALSLSGTPAWTELTPAGTPPPPRYRHIAIYDPVRERMIVYGGESDSVLDDVWALSLSGDPAWTDLGTGPLAVYDHAALYDPVRDQMLVFGGSDDSLHADTSLHNDVWAMSLGDPPQWSVVPTAGAPPVPRYRHSVIYDAANDRVVVFAGSDPSKRSDVYELSMAGTPTWTHPLPSGSPPSVRVGHSGTYDPVGGRMIVYGGIYGEPVRSDTRALVFDDPPRWSTPALAPPPPTPRVNHCAAYDAALHRIIVFGGYNVAFDFASDTWALNLDGVPGWTNLTPPGPRPAGRWYPSMIYDPIRDRMLLFGGFAGGSTYFNDVWQLTGGANPTWSLLAVSGRPPTPRFAHSAIYDPVRDRMIVYGGGGHEVWALSLNASPEWTQLAPLGTPPDDDQYHSAIYDPIRDRMIIYRSGVWALSLGDTPTWTQLAPTGLIPPPSDRHAAVYDPVHDQMVAFGGEPGLGYTANNDTWELTFGDPVKPAASCVANQGWQAGSMVDLKFAISHPLEGARSVEWTLSDDRGWPGLPTHGSLLVGGSALPETLIVPVAVPDTAAPGTNAMTLQVSFAGAAGNDTSCAIDLHDALTAVLASLVSADADPTGVHLAWRIANSGRVTIQRATGTSGWHAIGDAGPDGLGNVRWDDRDVTPGERYGYRLAWSGGSGTVVAGEVWLDVPSATTFALLGVRPNPASAISAVAFTLPARGITTLSVFDVAGRRVAPMRTVELGAGLHLLPLASGAALAPGVYAVDLVFGGRHLRTRAIVMR